MKLLSGLLASIMLVYLSPTLAADVDTNKLLEAAHSATLHVKDRNNVDVVIDEKKAVEEAILYKKIGLIKNSDVTVTSILMSPVTQSGIMVGLFNIKSFIYNIYKNTNAESIHINTYLLSENNYGHQEKHLIYSFDFTRSLYEQIIWNHFYFSNLIKIAPNFQFTDWYLNTIASEPAMRD